jgi:hypothetical protein
MSVHNVSATIFFIATVIHLTYNWKALTKYISTRTTEYFKLKKEMMIALFVVVVVVGLFSSHALHTH